jgi:hypothetical protein
MPQRLAPLLLAAALISGCGASDQPAPPETPSDAPATVVATLTEPPKPTPFATNTPVLLPNPPVLGGIDGVSGDLRTGGTIIVVGWAVDALFGAPAARVEVLMNEQWTFSTTTGDARPDIVAALGRNDARLSGWTSQISLGSLPAGQHTLGLRVFDVNGIAHRVPFTLPITVAAADATVAAGGALSETQPAPQTTLVGMLEKVDGTARPGWVVIVTGWAADTVGKTPAAKIELYVDDKVALTVKPTLDRQDVVDALKEKGLLKSGFSGRVPLADDLEPGPHLITAIAYDVAGNRLQLGDSIEIKVLAKL